MVESAGPAPSDELAFTREAIGAFAHEIRTPLTSLRMIFALAKMQSPEGELHLTGDLPDLLYTTVGSLESLADELQEHSRVERGRVTLASEGGDLGEVAREAIAAAAGIEAEADIRGPLPAMFDAPRLRKALGQLIATVDYSGAGSGRVTLTGRELDGRAELTMTSGSPGGAPRPVAADMGFEFFAAHHAILAMGAAVKCERSEGFLSITVSFSLGTV